MNECFFLYINWYKSFNLKLYFYRSVHLQNQTRVIYPVRERRAASARPLTHPVETQHFPLLGHPVTEIFQLIFQKIFVKYKRFHSWSIHDRNSKSSYSPTRTSTTIQTFDLTDSWTPSIPSLKSQRSKIQARSLKRFAIFSHNEQSIILLFKMSYFSFFVFFYN